MPNWHSQTILKHCSPYRASSRAWALCRVSVVLWNGLVFLDNALSALFVGTAKSTQTFTLIHWLVFVGVVSNHIRIEVVVLDVWQVWLHCYIIGMPSVWPRVAPVLEVLLSFDLAFVFCCAHASIFYTSSKCFVLTVLLEAVRVVSVGSVIIPFHNTNSIYLHFCSPVL